MLSFVLYAQTDFDLAENYYDKGEFEKALFIYQKLYEDNPVNSNLVFRIIEIQQELQRFEKADQVIKHQLSTSNNPQMLVELGYNFQLQNNFQQAEINYKKAIDAARTTINYGYAIALRFEEHSLVDQAIEVYQLALTQTKNSNYEYRLAGLYAEKKDISNMFLSYLNFTEQNPSFLNQIFRLFEDYISEDSEAEYNQMLKKIILKKLQTNPSIFWNQMLSWLYVQQADFNKALQQEKAIFRRNLTAIQGVIDVGLMAKSAKVYDVSLEAFKYVLKYSQSIPLTLEAHGQLLELELIRSDFTDYKKIQEQYQILFERYGITPETVKLHLSYADFLASHVQQKAQAISFLKDALKTPLPKLNLCQLKLKLADILVTNSQFSQALLYYAQVQTTLKNSTLAQEARFKSAQTSYFKGDFDWAEAQLQVLKSSTSQLIANDALDLKLLITDHKFGDSLQTPLRLYAKADFLHHQNKINEAVQVLHQLMDEHNTHAIVDQALLFQAKLYKALQQPQKAQANYLKIINDYSSEILVDDAHFALAELFRVELDQPEQAMHHYEQIIFNHPDSIHFVSSKKYFRQIRDKNNVPSKEDL